MAITLTPLCDALGAEIGGVDLAAELDPATAAAIKAALAEHIVLLFRNQDFGPEDQLRFARYPAPPAFAEAEPRLRAGRSASGGRPREWIML